ncbi:HET-domain-containing protein [Microthyrium microscopicum]|uniref:HET-domain-containing protein n=1 Tax=Microthyrium microscopicum TaxID=703497 RepID=A0A6A6UJ84_9PEZI|nr:HET-domain-containing protein [Microthyrium microscopicum]
MTDQNNIHNLNCSNTGEAKVLDRARFWMLKCLSDHTKCSSHEQPDYYPPRLLQIENDSVRVIESSDLAVSANQGRYATLSYCWGSNPKHLTLTAQNYDALKVGIKISSLAPTFREAMRTTTHLGFQLLWVDALCILQTGQGSMEDWQRHLSEMAVIYSNGVVNISADHGDNAETGVFVYRDPDAVKPCIIESTDPSQKVGSRENELYSITPRDYLTQLLACPLLHRAWVQQERLLSPRTLHFGGNQLIWECDEVLACETFPNGFVSQSKHFDERPPFSIHHTDAKAWWQIVKAYSRSSITHREDKLPAIAGIARRQFNQTQIPYVAGMFMKGEKGSIDALLWHFTGGPLGGTVSPYRAPSWVSQFLVNTSQSSSKYQFSTRRT